MPVPGRSVSERDEQELAQHREMLPAHLYRYMRIAACARGRGCGVEPSEHVDRMDWFKDIVLRSKLFFPGYLRLNDPFEGAMSFDFAAANDEEVRSYWEEFLQENGKPLDSEARTTIDGFTARRSDPATQAMLNADVLNNNQACGVACFGPRGDDMLMWSYYADGHAGVCLRFRSEALSQLVDCFAPVPVTYAEEIPRPSFYRTSTFAKAQALLATKSEVWQHEKEWRVICLKEGVLDLDPTALDAVILGCRMRAQDKARVRSVVEQLTPPVPVIEARRDESRFRIIVPE